MSDNIQFKSDVEFDPGVQLKKAQIESGTTNPATASVGQMFFNTTTGDMLVCFAVNTWTIIATFPDVQEKANKASPTFTGTPTAPTAAADTNTTQVATCAFIVRAIGNLNAANISDFGQAVRSAVDAYIDTTAGTRENLDTLSEIIAKIQANTDGLAGISSKYGTTIGDGSATSISVDHNFNTRRVSVIVRENAAPYSEVQVSNRAETTNRVTLTFKVAPTANQFEVTVIG